jgi:hypothetical protein
MVITRGGRRTGADNIEVIIEENRRLRNRVNYLNELRNYLLIRLAQMRQTIIMQQLNNSSSESSFTEDDEYNDEEPFDIYYD